MNQSESMHRGFLVGTVIVGAIVLILGGCVSDEPPKQPPVSVTAPIKKAKSAAKTAEEKAAQREQQDPASPTDSPLPTP